MAPSPILSYLVTDHVPPFSQRMAISLISDLLIRMTEHLHLTYSSEGHALTSNLVGTNPTTISEWPPVPDWDTW